MSRARRAPAGRRASVPAAWLVASAVAVAGCSTRTVDAVDLGASDAASLGGGGALSWPNETSSANSDPWLAAHHDALTGMHPRLLVLDFYDGPDPTQPMPVSALRAVAEQEVFATAEGSRYHGYADPSAPAFLVYDLVGVVDLTDHPAPSGWAHPSSSLLPVDAAGAFDASALFTQAFAASYGFVDPAAPARYLTLCELFERGLVNELWLAVGDDPPRRPGLLWESKQVYDAAGRAVPGSFEPCAGYACYPGPPVPRCNVTVRIAHLDPRFELGCDLIARSVGIENTRLAIPYLQDNALAFFNQDFDRPPFNLRYSSWEDLCSSASGATGAASCVSYPSPSVARGTYSDGTPWTVDPFVQGCGTAHFPPNARFEWDYANTQPVQSRCEHYAMHDAPDGGDVLDLYESTKVAAYTARYGDPDAGGGGCGSGWQVYYRQNMPGLGNRALAADGSPMKNWWPYLFY